MYFSKTSMPSVDDYYQVFLPLAKQDVPMICICITTKFSGSMQSATTARDMILEEYPKARITVIDAEINTVPQGLYVLEACRLRDLGWEYRPHGEEAPCHKGERQNLLYDRQH